MRFIGCGSSRKIPRLFFFHSNPTKATDKKRRLRVSDTRVTRIGTTFPRAGRRRRRENKSAPMGCRLQRGLSERLVGKVSAADAETWELPPGDPLFFDREPYSLLPSIPFPAAAAAAAASFRRRRGGGGWMHARVPLMYGYARTYYVMRS